MPCPSASGKRKPVGKMGTRVAAAAASGFCLTTSRHSMEEQHGTNRSQTTKCALPCAIIFLSLRAGTTLVPYVRLVLFAESKVFTLSLAVRLTLLTTVLYK